MRKRIRETIQIMILAFSCYNGFFFSYSFIWFAFNLPATRWAMLLLSFLAFASLYGFYKWLDRSFEMKGE